MRSSLVDTRKTACTILVPCRAVLAAEQKSRHFSLAGGIFNNLEVHDCPRGGR